MVRPRRPRRLARPPDGGGDAAGVAGSGVPDPEAQPTRGRSAPSPPHGLLHHRRDPPPRELLHLLAHLRALPPLWRIPATGLSFPLSPSSPADPGRGQARRAELLRRRWSSRSSPSPGLRHAAIAPPRLHGGLSHRSGAQAGETGIRGLGFLTARGRDRAGECDGGRRGQAAGGGRGPLLCPGPHGPVPGQQRPRRQRSDRRRSADDAIHLSIPLRRPRAADERVVDC